LIDKGRGVLFDAAVFWTRTLCDAVIRFLGSSVLQEVMQLQETRELQLGDVHFTVLQKVFDYTGNAFGTGNKIVPDFLA
jgi:hypothetical protein